MNRDDDNEEIIPRPPTGGQRRTVKSRGARSRGNRMATSPMAREPFVRDSLDRDQLTGRSAAKASIIVPLPEPPLPRGPSYPAWERPLKNRDYPQLRGQEQHRPWWPLLAVGLAVVMVTIIVLVIPTVMGNNKPKVAAASASATTSSHASGSSKPSVSGSVRPSTSVKPQASQTPTGTPGPTISFKQYQVVKGDTAVKIATRFGLKTWELLLANPQIGSSGIVKLGQWLNIPEPGQLTPPPPATPTPLATDTPAGG